MIKRSIVIGVVITACGLGLACIFFATKGRSLHGGPQVYDLIDGKFDRIGAPKVLPFAGWAVYEPGLVRIDMPNGISIAGRPASLNFDETAVGRGLIYYCEGQRFSDAYQLALSYCRQYGIDPKTIIEWHDQGKGQARFPHGGADNGNRPGMSIGVDVLNLLSPPCGFVVEVSFGWPKTFNKSEVRSVAKSASEPATP